MGKFTNEFNTYLKTNYHDYERKLFQTYLTAPEWRNVEMAMEYAKFLQAGNAFYQPWSMGLGLHIAFWII